MKLNQVVATEKVTKNNAHRDWTDSYKRVQVPGPFTGMTRTYEPAEEGGETLPAESTKVQTTVDEELTIVRRALAKLFDIEATKDYANTDAKANVALDGDEALIPDAPVTLLLALEKHLTDLRTYFSHLPELDPATNWHADPASGLYRSDETETNRTAKRLEAKVLYTHTEKHPAQVESFTVDRKVGTYVTTKFSGAITKERKRTLLERTDALLRAVRFAREEANKIEVTEVKIADKLLDFLFAN